MLLACKQHDYKTNHTSIKQINESWQFCNSSIIHMHSLQIHEDYLT